MMSSRLAPLLGQPCCSCFSEQTAVCFEGAETHMRYFRTQAASAFLGQRAEV